MAISSPAVADAELGYADLLSTGADDTSYRLDLVAQGAQDPAVRLRVRLLVAGFGGIEDAEDALPEPPSMLESRSCGRTYAVPNNLASPTAVSLPVSRVLHKYPRLHMNYKLLQSSGIHRRHLKWSLRILALSPLSVLIAG